MVTVLVAILAGAGNLVLYRWKRNKAVVTLVPWWEEFCKLLAVLSLSGQPILPVHIVFGSLELGHAAWQGQRFLGLISFCIHGLTGGVAAYLAGAAGNVRGGLLFAVLGAATLHVLLNGAVVGLVFPTLGISGDPVDPSLGGRYNWRE